MTDLYFNHDLINLVLIVSLFVYIDYSLDVLKAFNCLITKCMMLDLLGFNGDFNQFGITNNGLYIKL